MNTDHEREYQVQLGEAGTTLCCHSHGTHTTCELQRRAVKSLTGFQHFVMLLMYALPHHQPIGTTRLQRTSHCRYELSIHLPIVVQPWCRFGTSLADSRR